MALKEGISYVKFLRGTPTAFEKLTTKNPDTLYFISEKDAKVGELYLGEKLIAGGAAGDISNLTLEDIKNISIDPNVEDGSFLTYDSIQEKWVNTSPEEILNIIVSEMEGASEEADGKSGLVPVPKAGEQDLFLRGDGTWADPTSDLEDIIASLVGEDYDGEKSLKELVVQALTEVLITEDAKESLDTLEEIADWIQNHPDDLPELNTRVIDLEEAVFGKESEEEGQELVPGLVSITSNLQDELDALTERVSTNESDISEIYERLAWHDMSDEDGSIIN